MSDDVKKLSVTANDAGDVRRGSIWHFIVTTGTLGLGQLPQWWQPARDYYLRQSIYRESTWADAVYIAVTKMASRAWEVESDAPRTRNQFQQLLLEADANQSWVHFLSRHLRDYLCTDNGAFVEIVRASSAAGSRIVGLMHLDSLRMTRTGDPDYPAIYRDTKGQEHEMRAHQVIMLSDMPDSAETWYGVGYCAASRAWLSILKMQVIETYIYDKVSGQRPLAIDLVGGISPQQVQTAIQNAKEQREAQSQLAAGFAYMGSILIPTMGAEVPASHERINFAELPDGFDRQQEFNICMLQYANALGLDPQDLQPLSSQRLGTAMQSEVLSEKAKGKGTQTWAQQFTHLVNQFILPDTVTFAFEEKDLRDKQQQADISQKRVATIGTLIDKGIITTAQAAQMLADEDEIPEEFVPLDTTPSGTITDADQPESEAEQAQAQVEAQVAPAPPPVPPQQATREATRKSIADLASGYEAELKRLAGGAASGRLSASDMAQTHRSLIAGLALVTFIEGLKAGGVDESELDESDQAQIDGWVSGQMGYVEDLARAAANKQNVDTRIGLWVRSLEAIGNAGRMSAEANRMGTWKLALEVEDHCATCMQLHNVRHRLKWFTGKGYIPREPGSATLECKGFRCGCRIISDSGEQLL